MSQFLDAIRSLFGAPHDHAAPPRSTAEDQPSAAPNPVHLAACALLLEIAYADGEFTAPERKHLESVLERHFALPVEAGRQLIELADQERRRSIDHFHFTSILRDSYDVGQKMVLAEVMWGLVLADGQIAEREAYLTRKIANLLDLEAGYLSTAKRSAEEQASRRAKLAGG